VDHHLKPQNPYAIGDGAQEAKITDALLKDTAISMPKLAKLISTEQVED